MAEFILYDTCPTVFEKRKLKIIKQLNKDKIDFSIEEKRETRTHNREWRYGRWIESDLVCTDIEKKTRGNPPRCKKCPLHLKEARGFSEITTKISFADPGMAS